MPASFYSHRVDAIKFNWSKDIINHSLKMFGNYSWVKSILKISKTDSKTIIWLILNHLLNVNYVQFILLDIHGKCALKAAQHTIHMLYICWCDAIQGLKVLTLSSGIFVFIVEICLALPINYSILPASEFLNKLRIVMSRIMKIMEMKYKIRATQWLANYQQVVFIVCYAL